MATLKFLGGDVDLGTQMKYLEVITSTGRETSVDTAPRCVRSVWGLLYVPDLFYFVKACF